MLRRGQGIGAGVRAFGFRAGGLEALVFAEGVLKGALGSGDHAVEAGECLVQFQEGLAEGDFSPKKSNRLLMVIFRSHICTSTLGSGEVIADELID